MPMPTVSEYICDGELLPEERHAQPHYFTPKLRGVNLGGWLVLQPWITPSLFYQFEDQPPEKTAMDMLGFCKVLGPVEGNRQLREHWRQWVTEDDLRRLAAQGVNTVRVPVGDWIWESYEPYTGCTNGSLTELRRVLRICEVVGLRVLVDLHGVRRSQNGFDNSGYAANVSWAADGTHFAHWPCRSAGWQGSFDPVSYSYTTISWDNLRGTVSLLQRIALSLRGFPAVLGLEALNEPWQFTPMDVLKAFYWDAYWAVRAAAPEWLFVVQDSFRLDEWGGFMKGCPAVAIDTHVYQAWFDIRSQESFLENACSWRSAIRSMQSSTLPVLIGEWSLATDNCAMWLNGFHDNAPGFPKVTCGSVKCPEPYVSGIRGAPQGPPPGPFGTGVSAPSFGTCAVSKGWDNEDEIMQKLGQRKLSAFDEAAGWFFWNFKVETKEPHWSWELSTQRGWLPTNLSAAKVGARSMPQYLNVCTTDKAQMAGHGAGSGSNPGGDLPWYNALPSRAVTSPVVLLMGLGLTTLICAAVLLKMVLNVLVKTSMKNRAQPANSLELPPRLLRLARRSQGRKPGGLGVLGLKQRVSSRTLTQLAFPLMNLEHAIEEADEEALLESPQCNFSYLSQGSLRRPPAAERGLKGVSSGTSSSSSSSSSRS